MRGCRRSSLLIVPSASEIFPPKSPLVSAGGGSLCNRRRVCAAGGSLSVRSNWCRLSCGVRDALFLNFILTLFNFRTFFHFRVFFGFLVVLAIGLVSTLTATKSPQGLFSDLCCRISDL
jgi:hypothetical protein